MRIVNAVWEKRNLNLETLEITIEKSDGDIDPQILIGEIETVCKQQHTEFVLLKVPAGHTSLDIELQKKGFVLMETQIGLKLLRKNAETVFRQMEDKISLVDYRKVTDEGEIASLKQEICKGIFHTDRFSLDPLIGTKLANQRYSNWLQDELERGAILFTFQYNKEEIGFFLNRKINSRKQYLLLGGIFIKYKDDNLGSLMNCAQIKEFIQGDLAITETGVSSNNIVILKLYEMFGYRVNKLTYMYTKHL